LVFQSRESRLSLLDLLAINGALSLTRGAERILLRPRKLEERLLLPILFALTEGPCSNEEMASFLNEQKEKGFAQFVSLAKRHEEEKKE